MAIFFTSTIFGQPQIPSEKDLNNFYNSTTYVLLNNNMFGMYNSSIRSAADTYWTITPHKYINKDDYKRKKKFPLASFILQTTTHFKDQENLGVFTSLSVLGGHKSGNIDLMPDMATLPLAYDDVDYDEYDYKMGLALRFIQNHIEWLKANPNVEEQMLFQHFRKAQIKTSDKILYMRKSEVEEELRSLSQIRNYYSGKVVFASPEEIKEIIDSKDEDALILHIVAPASNQRKSLCIKMIISAKDAKLHYFDFHQIKKRKPGKFLSSDFKTINEF